MPNNLIPPVRHRMLIPSATLAAMRAELDAFGLPAPGFHSNLPPLTPAQLQAELALLAPLKPPAPHRQPALHNLPECSPPIAGAKRTQLFMPLPTPANCPNVPQSSTAPHTSISAK